MLQADSGNGARASALWGTGGRGGDSRSRLRSASSIAALALVSAALLAPAATAGNPRIAPPLDTQITSGPVEGSSATARTATFAFSATRNAARFECRLDGAAFRPCTSPLTLSALDVAKHSFAVRAIAGSEVDATPATRGWSVEPWVSNQSYDPGTLLARAKATPFKTFRVIVETDSRRIQRLLAKFSSTNGALKHDFTSIAAINATLPGWAVLALGENRAQFGHTTVTEDVPVKLSDLQPSELWPLAMKADALWPKDAVTCDTDPETGFQLDPACAPAPAIQPPAPPAIAVVDSGVDASRAADFGARVVASVPLSQLSPGETGDGLGHGTFVASIAAGSEPTHPGVAPAADIVSLRVMDDQGQALTSDVIAAADWILQNKDEYGIRVANFSLHSARPSSFRFDPLDHAVERLWFSGVVVVTAAGNYGDGTPQRMAYAPGNDPFVLTVGAADLHGTVATDDDDVAYWSAYGYTLDGFAKPELVAPGRYMLGAVPPTATLMSEKPDNVAEPGYMRLSGTSFSSPAVAGAAAQLLAVHPDWTADQVKGALMATAVDLPTAQPLAIGMGEVDLAAAAAVSDPPNPNAGLDAFVVDDTTQPGGKVFDDVSWDSAAQADVSWDSVSWSDVSWGDVSWSDVSWSSVSWSDSAQADAALADVSWDSVSWCDNAASG